MRGGEFGMLMMMLMLMLMARECGMVAYDEKLIDSRYSS